MSRPIGIVNVGNTCSISTCVQCIHALESLREVLCDPAAFEQGFGNEMKRMLVTLKQRTDHPVNPSDFLSRLYEEGGALFPRGEQHDLCELWVWLIDRLHSESACARPMTNTKNRMERAVLEVLHRYQQGRYSKILDVAQGSQISIVVCHHCGYRVTNIEPFTVLPLDIVSEESLEDMLKRYMGLAQLSDWTCDRCHKQGASKMTRLYHCPRVLVVSLNRFHMTNQGHMKKKSCAVQIPSTLGFHPKAVVSLMASDSPVTYNLVATGNHFGSYGGGHYTATIRNQDTWYHMDDISVDTYSSEEEARKHANGCSYILFYERA